MTTRRTFLALIASAFAAPAAPLLAAPEPALIRDRYGWIAQHSADGHNWADARQGEVAPFVRWRRPSDEAAA